MLEGWFFAKRVAHRPEDVAASPASALEPVVGRAQLVGGGPLDALGQQSESVRDRVNRMAERLDEVRTLSAEFGLIVGPLNEFVDQHAASRARLMEVEALLARERDLGAAARTELGALQVAGARLNGDLQDALAALASRDETIGRQDTQVAELRIRFADLKSHADSLDARLFAEVGRAQAASDDNVGLRHEAASAEEARVAAERGLAETRETLGLTEAEASRLRALAETLSLRIAGLNRTVADIEPQLQIARNTAALIQTRFGVEQSARQKSEVARDAERGEHEMELASASLKIDGLNAHLVNTDKLIAHLRDQLHDRSEAFRSADKGMRDAVAERLASERRLDSVLDASARTNTQLGDAQRAGVELANRVDMLAKAVAAKDQALDAANRKSATLLDRIESINARFASERSEFEVTHRRMIEDLQNERAERSLAHGALDIARKSRSSLLAQYTALKRRTGAVDGQPLDEEPEPVRTVDSNVMPFAPPESVA